MRSFSFLSPQIYNKPIKGHFLNKMNSHQSQPSKNSEQTININDQLEPTKNKFQKRINHIKNISNVKMNVNPKNIKHLLSLQQNKSSVHSQGSLKYEQKYLFLHKQDDIQNDPFLRAKMKYLVKKEKCKLKKNIDKSIVMNQQANKSFILEEEFQDKRFTTLKKEKIKNYDENVQLLNKFKDKFGQDQ